MKKLNRILSLALALCLLCSIALADVHPVDGDGAYIHNYNVGVENPNATIVSYPSLQKDRGLIRFPCEYRGEYEDPEAPGYLPDAQDFQEYVIYAIPEKADDLFPADVEGAQALIDAHSDLVDWRSYKAPTCTQTGYVKIYSYLANVANDYTELNYDGVIFTGWQGKWNGYKEYTLPALGHLPSNDAELNPSGLVEYRMVKEATCTEGGEMQVVCVREGCGAVLETVYTDAKGHLAPERVLDEIASYAATCVDEGMNVYKWVCPRCGEELEKPIFIVEPDEEILDIDPLAHVWGEWIVEEETTWAATCTEPGQKTEYRLCWLCGAKEVNVTEYPALGHDEAHKIGIVKTEPTCMEEGLLEYFCPRCGEKIGEEPIDVDPDAHPAEYWTLTYSQDPTCNLPGIKEYTCGLCGNEFEFQFADALDHVWSEEPIFEYDGWCGDEIPEEDAADLANYGYEEGPVPAFKVYACVCECCDPCECDDLIKMGDVPAHEWSDWTQRNPYEEGVTPAYWIRQCLVCGQHEESVRNDTLNPNDECDMNGHNYAWTVTKEATCTEEGLRTGICRRCNDTVTEAIAKIAHTPEAVEAVAATCTETGLTEGSVCAVCGEVLVEQEEIPANGHDWQRVDAVAATCTEEGVTVSLYCDVCGEELLASEVIPALGHDYVEEVTKAATCTEEGEKTFTCSRCGDTYTETIEKIAHDEEILPAVAATCTADGLTEGKKCSVCGEILVAQEEIAALGHDWDDGEITTEATPSADGVKTYTCSRCGETKEEAVAYEFNETPAYSFVEGTVVFNGTSVSGKIAHDETTVEADRLYVRYTLFFTNGTYAVIRDLVENGEFNTPIYGSIDSIGIELIGSSDSLAPGEYDFYDSYPINVQ